MGSEGSGCHGEGECQVRHTATTAPRNWKVSENLWTTCRARVVIVSLNGCDVHIL